MAVKLFMEISLIFVHGRNKTQPTQSVVVLTLPVTLSSIPREHAKVCYAKHHPKTQLPKSIRTTLLDKRVACHLRKEDCPKGPKMR